MKIKFSNEQIEKLAQHIEREYPHEACGFFMGQEDGEERVVTDIWEVQNVSTENQRRRFVINPLDYLSAEQRADSENKALLGVYHSHPDHPAFPSEHDLASAQPYFSYVIANVQEGKTGAIRSYRLDTDTFIEEIVQNQES